jgi:hypothetical protein
MEDRLFIVPSNTCHTQGAGDNANSATVKATFAVSAPVLFLASVLNHSKYPTLTHYLDTQVRNDQQQQTADPRVLVTTITASNSTDDMTYSRSDFIVNGTFVSNSSSSLYQLYSADFKVTNTSTTVESYFFDIVARIVTTANTTETAGGGEDSDEGAEVVKDEYWKLMDLMDPWFACST